MERWPADADDLAELQRRLAVEADAARTDDPTALPADPLLGGCFVAYARGEAGPGRAGDRAWAAAVTWRPVTGRRDEGAALRGVRHGPEPRVARDTHEQVVVAGTVPASYAPGLLAMREGALLEAAVRALREPPDVLLVDATGLFNRRYLMESLASELSRCQREDSPLSVVLVDVDHFKRVNDTLGHEAGDRILTAVADLLRSRVRNGDAACRYGGEEFVVVLPGTTVEVAAARADRWRKELATSSPVDGLEAVTISVGVAAAPTHGTTGSELLRAADEAMYAAKAGGRDQVVVAEAGQVPKTWLSS